MTGIFQLSICHLRAKYSPFATRFYSVRILFCEICFVNFKLNLNKKISANITGRHCMKKQGKAINIGVKIDITGPVEKGGYITYIKLMIYRN